METYQCVLICFMVISSVCYIQCEEIEQKILYLLKGDSDKTQTPECLNVLNKIPLNGSIPQWALKMVDATAKLQSGILSGNLMNLGDYDECIAIVDHKEGIQGKFCLMSYQLAKDTPMLYGVCLPKVCNLAALIPSEEHGFFVHDNLCATNETIYDFGDVLFILIFGSTALLVGVATAYDLYHRSRESFEFNRVLMSFSIYTNTKKLTHINPSEISCLYGIRVLSMMWIIYGHRASVMMGIPAINSKELHDIKYSSQTNHIYAANFAVDTFFFLSGFLVAYNTLKNNMRLKLWHVPRFIIHRLLRIFPTVATIFLVVVTISRRAGSGPFYNLGVENARIPCVDHWWSYFLFIQNYVNYDYLCLSQTWYLSVDIQMHILSPLILIPLGKLFAQRKAAKIRLIFLILILFFMFGPMIIALNADNSNVYATHWRIAVYLIGIYAGMRAVNIETFTIKFSKHVYWLLWAGVLVMMIIVAIPGRQLIQYPNSIDAIMSSTFGRPVWGLCMAWIILNCMAGHSPLINKFLSLPLFEVLSRLTFCMYAIHNLEIGYQAISTRQSIYLNEFVIVQAWFADLFLTLFFSYFWSMMFEVPIIHLDKIIFERRQLPKAKQPTQKI